ncbi:15019_t:CDS:10 [Funneliformis caledonium]|uniref:15019_t:CDS:1 n=1 Tax=Funneliformis caledonium TaxID=1117310 RepID=A0A9N8V9V7_9GLOM|nr:15019_t:CDS:10 [Funneliformis caledonium]
MEKYSVDEYFETTTPEKYRFLDYYKDRKNRDDFTNNFRLEARRLHKCLNYLVENGSNQRKQKAQHLLDVFEASSMEDPVKSREGEHTSTTTRWGPPAVLRRGNTHTTMAGACVPPDLTAFIRSRCGLLCQQFSYLKAPLLSAFPNHRNKNVDIDRFWNEVERESLDIDHAKEKSQLKLDQVKIARAMTKGTEEGVENIMKNVNKELDESVTDNDSKPYSLRKRPRVEYNENRISKRQEQEDEYTSPTLISPKLHSLPMDNPSMGNPFIEEGVQDYPIIINDIPDELSFEDEDSIDDLKIREINVSRLFRQYQNQSIKIAKTGGLFVESNVHEILSLSSILLLNPGSHSKTMIDIFSTSLLDDIYQQANPPQQIELNTELTNDQMLNENLGSMFLECLKKLPTTKIKNEPSETTLITNYLDHIMREMLHDPDKHFVEWPNAEINESKARKPQGRRSKQPDFTASIIHQLQLNSIIFVGEVSPPSEKNNVYKNCNDLIRVGVFMKDCLDSSIELGAEIKILGFQCVDYTVEFYMMDLVQGMYIMIHIGKVTIPASLREVSNFIDDLEILLKIRKVFQESFNIFFDKLCNPSSSSTKMKFKRDTLATPMFKKLVNKTHNCHRSCPFCLLKKKHNQNIHEVVTLSEAEITDSDEDSVKIARAMTKGTEEGVENIMKNVNKELDESVTDNDSKPYSLRKRPRVEYNENRISKRQEQEDEYTSPTLISPKLHSLPMDNPSMGNPFIEEGVQDYPIIINDIPDELSFEDEDSIDDLKIREINVSRLFRQYQNQSIKIAKTGGLFVESNVHEILSLSSILLLNPGSHSKTMIDIFSTSLLDDIYQQANPPQQIELNT